MRSTLLDILICPVKSPVLVAEAVGAGLGYKGSEPGYSNDGLEMHFAVNVLAPSRTVPLEAGANVRVARADNWTALHSAVTNEHIGATRLLVEAGIPLDAAQDGWTSLTFVGRDGLDAFATLLLDAGAAVGGSPFDGPRPLRMAAQSGHGSMVQLLLDEGASPDRGGATTSPLSIAVENGHTDVVRLLLEAGVDAENGGADFQAPSSRLRRSAVLTSPRTSSWPVRTSTRATRRTATGRR